MGGPGAARSMFVNGLGAVATGITTAVVLVAKFTDGAWITVLLVPGLILMMRAIQAPLLPGGPGNLYVYAPVHTDNLFEPIVLLPIDGWSLVSEKALRYAWTLSREIHVLHVECGDKTDELCRQWGAIGGSAR